MLTPRQELILRKVVEGHLDGGQPMGSKSLAEGVDWGPSTVRNELALLEEQGLLAHPHTSAGRVPTESGYRYFVDRLLGAEPAQHQSLSLSLVRSELDEAMRITTATLSQVTDLLAIVSAPPVDTATIRHVEVLVLQPHVVMVVVITSTGAVAKRLFTFDSPVDTGLADWAASYLNERLDGTGLGARTLHLRLEEPSLSSTEHDFIMRLTPAFTELEGEGGDALYVDGTARLLTGYGSGERMQLNEMMELLERRVTMLGVLRAALAGRSVSVRIGHENESPALHSLALVAASYGLPQRSLGAVSVIGPLRMDYALAIGSVRDAALQLSSFVGDIYGES